MTLGPVLSSATGGKGVICGICFLDVQFIEFFYILDISPLLHVELVKVFSHLQDAALFE